MKKVQRYDSYLLVAGAVKTPEGYLLDSPIVARTGIYTYANPDGSVRREYRPPEEVFAEDALASFKGKPITVLHPKNGRVTADTARRLTIGTIMSPAYRKDDTNLACDIIIHTPQEIKDYRELSVGYTVELEETPGVTENGETYDAVQHLIRCNHLAVVPSARAGRKARLNLDGDEVLESEVSNNMVKIRIDTNEFEVEQAVANHVTALTAKVDAADAKASAAEVKFEQASTELGTVKTDAAEAHKKLDAMTAERDALQTKLDAATTEKEEAVKQAVEVAQKEVKERIDLEDVAQKAKVEKIDGMDNKAIKIAIIKAVRGDSFDVEGKSDSYIDAAYDFASADLKNDGQAVVDQLRLIKTKNDGTQEVRSDAEERRNKMISGYGAQEEK